MKDRTLRVDRETFPGVALVIYPASVSNINRAMEQVEAGADLSAVSLSGGKVIAMRRQDWQMLYDAWRYDVDVNKMFQDAEQAMQDMTKGMPP